MVGPKGLDVVAVALLLRGELLLELVLEPLQLVLKACCCCNCCCCTVSC